MKFENTDKEVVCPFCYSNEMERSHTQELGKGKKKTLHNIYKCLDCRKMIPFDSKTNEYEGLKSKKFKYYALGIM